MKANGGGTLVESGPVHDDGNNIVSLLLLSLLLGVRKRRRRWYTRFPTRQSRASVTRERRYVAATTTHVGCAYDFSSDVFHIIIFYSYTRRVYTRTRIACDDGGGGGG